MFISLFLMVKPPPPHFSQYLKKGRYYLRCTKTITTSLGVVRCSYETRKDCAKLEHKCQFNSLYSYAKKEAELSDPNTKFPSSEIIDSLMNLISATDISFRVACSQQMCNLIYTCIQFGVKYGKEYETHMFPSLGREKMKKMFIDKANYKRARSLQALVGQYACILLDASTDISQSCLDIVVSHPTLHPHPIVIDSLDNFGGLTENYREVVSRIVHELNEQGIMVASITSDNLIAQVQAINPREESSFQYVSDNPNDKCIIWNSCICHVLALGINLFFQDEAVAPMISAFKDVVCLLRKKPIRQYIKATCIAPSNTRWNVIYSQMLWCIRHITEIVNLIKCNQENIKKYVDPLKGTIINVLLDIIPVFIFPLHFVAAAVNVAQADSFQASYILPLMNNLQKLIRNTSSTINQSTKEGELQKNVISNSVNISKKLNDSITFMFSKHSPRSLLHLMYTLTPEGREEFRTSFPAIIVSSDPKEACIGQKGFNNMDQDKTTIIDYINKLQETKTLISNETSEPPDDNQTNDYIVDNSTDDESSDEDIPREYIELAETNDNAIIDSDDPTAFLINTLAEHLILIHEKKDVDLAIQCFLNWLMLSTDELTITPIIKSSPLQIWKYLGTKREWSVLANFSLRCLSTVASESGVERLFSQHKHVVDYLRRRTSKELRIARLNMKDDL